MACITNLRLMLQFIKLGHRIEFLLCRFPVLATYHWFCKFLRFFHLFTICTMTNTITNVITITITTTTTCNFIDIVCSLSLKTSLPAAPSVNQNKILVDLDKNFSKWWYFSNGKKFHVVWSGWYIQSLLFRSLYHFLKERSKQSFCNSIAGRCKFAA